MAPTALARNSRPLAMDAAALEENPHAAFRALRPHYPLIRLSDQSLMAICARDVIPLLTSRETRQVEGSDYVRMIGISPGRAHSFLKGFFMFSNGRDHRTARGLFSRSFSLGRIRAERPTIRAVADSIVRDLPRGEPFDFVDAMSARVPTEMIASLLGLDRRDGPVFARQVYTLSRALGPAYPHWEHAVIDRAAEELFTYVEQQLRRRLEMPCDDLLSAVVASWNEQPEMPFHALVHHLMGMIIGGVDTTRAAFAMLVALLLSHPGQWHALCREPQLISGAVAEGLRYEPSVGSLVRVVGMPTTIGGFEVSVGTPLRLSTMSAMRDPELYADPDRFDIRRTGHPRLHTVFGHGPHRCIGEMLARSEMEEALAALVEMAPGIRLLKAPEMRGFGGIRQVTPMIVQIP